MTSEFAASESGRVSGEIESADFEVVLTVSLHEPVKARALAYEVIGAVMKLNGPVLIERMSLEVKGPPEHKGKPRLVNIRKKKPLPGYNVPYATNRIATMPPPIDPESLARFQQASDEVDQVNRRLAQELGI